MNIKIGNLTITNFCFNNIDHIMFKKVLDDDDLIYDFVSTTVGEDLINTTDSDNIILDNAYIVCDGEIPVGVVYFMEIKDNNSFIELRGAIHPEYRRLGYLGYHDSDRTGYGEMILKECSDYLFHFPGIDGVELHIRKDNIASIGCAIKSGYIYEGENNNEYYYVYRKYKKV